MATFFSRRPYCKSLKNHCGNTFRGCEKGLIDAVQAKKYHVTQRVARFAIWIIVHRMGGNNILYAEGQFVGCQPMTDICIEPEFKFGN